MHSSHGTFLGMQDSVMVKGLRDDLYFVGLWLDGKFELAYVAPVSNKIVSNPRKVTATELKRVLRECGTSQVASTAPAPASTTTGVA